MKLIVLPPDTASPYKPINSSEETQIKSIDYSDLSSIPKSSFNEVVAFNVLESSEKPLLEDLLTKLAKGGKLTVRGEDLYECSKSVASGAMPSDIFEAKIIKDKAHCTIFSDLLMKLQSLEGYVVIFGSILGTEYMVEVIKNA
jgi:hypothetical protein